MFKTMLGITEYNIYVFLRDANNEYREAINEHLQIQIELAAEKETHRRRHRTYSSNN